MLSDRDREIGMIISRLTAAIAAGGDLPSLLAELKNQEKARAVLDNERRQIEALTRADRLDLRRVERDLLQRVDEWRAAAGRNVAQGRQVLRKLLHGHRVAMRPLDDGTCELSGRADYGKLFSGIVATALASPKRDSNPCFALMKELRLGAGGRGTIVAGFAHHSHKLVDGGLR
jgi:hypothetical protein